MTKFRYHRGGYAESMATEVPCANVLELFALVGTEDIIIRPYGGIDQRNGWDTYIVLVSGSPVGFTDGPVLRSTPY
jgi:hypothetical protein